MVKDAKGTTLLEWIVVVVLVVGLLGGVLYSIFVAAQGRLNLIQGAM
jgi:Tfp pilus assembly protein PilE